MVRAENCGQEVTNVYSIIKGIYGYLILYSYIKRIVRGFLNKENKLLDITFINRSCCCFNSIDHLKLQV